MKYQPTPTTPVEEKPPPTTHTAGLSKKIAISTQPKRSYEIDCETGAITTFSIDTKVLNTVEANVLLHIHNNPYAGLDILKTKKIPQRTQVMHTLQVKSVLSNIDKVLGKHRARPAANHDCLALSILDTAFKFMETTGLNPGAASSLKDFAFTIENGGLGCETIGIYNSTPIASLDSTITHPFSSQGVYPTSAPTPVPGMKTLAGLSYIRSTILEIIVQLLMSKVQKKKFTGFSSKFERSAYKRDKKPKTKQKYGHSEQEEQARVALFNANVAKIDFPTNYRQKWRTLTTQGKRHTLISEAIEANGGSCFSKDVLALIKEFELKTRNNVLQVGIGPRRGLGLDPVLEDLSKKLQKMIAQKGTINRVHENCFTNLADGSKEYLKEKILEELALKVHILETERNLLMEYKHDIPQVASCLQTEIQLCQTNFNLPDDKIKALRERVNTVQAASPIAAGGCAVAGAGADEGAGEDDDESKITSTPRPS